MGLALPSLFLLVVELSKLDNEVIGFCQNYAAQAVFLLPFTLVKTNNFCTHQTQVD